MLRATLIGFAFLVHVTGVGHTTDTRDVVAKKPAAPKVEYDGSGYFYGTVTAVTPTALTLSSPGWREGRQVIRDGKCINIWAQTPPHAVKQFQWSRALAAGGPPGNRGDQPSSPLGVGQPSENYRYRVNDIQVGDTIEMFYCRVDGVDVCDSFSIIRRPGGKVPPSPGDENLRAVVNRTELTLNTSRHHERCQAYQEWELNGTPLPKWLWNGGEQLNLNPPYPPTAPLPRVAKQ